MASVPVDPDLSPEKGAYSPFNSKAFTQILPTPHRAEPLLAKPFCCLLASYWFSRTGKPLDNWLVGVNSSKDEAIRVA
ncbi:hypothetical protein MKX08_005612 [Trichoderma sp. CBMAI-0020]|nr:hypothetical protein MKX08_005612 [Trichoderma sp. CBMAI-0020]